MDERTNERQPHVFCETIRQLLLRPSNRPQSVYSSIDTSNEIATDNCRKQSRVQTADRKFICTVCDKKFTKPSKLKVHTRIHTGERPFNCTVCDKNFIEFSKLNAHMRVHSGERPYSCEVCRRTFTLSSTLRNHMFVHTGQRPFSCEVCAKSFTRSTKLKSHIRVHIRDGSFAELDRKRHRSIGGIHVENSELLPVIPHLSTQ